MQRAWRAVWLAALCSACNTLPSTTEDLSTSGGAGGAAPADAHASASGSGQGGYDGDKTTCATLYAKLDLAIADTWATKTTPGGATLAVITDGCGEWVGAAGNASTEREMMPGYLMRVGGITQSYVAATLMRLATAGAVSLDDSIASYVPGVPHGEQITLRMLLQHTSGVFDYRNDEAFWTHALNHPDEALSPLDLLNVASTHEPVFAPATGWARSDTGYILAGLVIEAITGHTAGVAIHSHAFSRADLHATFLDGEELVPAPLATGHGLDGESLTHALHPTVSWTAGGVVANASDLARWTRALCAGDVLSAAERSTMLQAVPAGDTDSYGLGLFVLGAESMGGLGEGLSQRGDLPGYHARTLFLRDDGTTVAAIVNSDERSPDAFVDAALMAVYR